MDLMNLSGDELWRWLRGTRWKPPKAAAADLERRETYVFALEQAEQMFRAAATVGPATQPLLIFYGLSQAGRAIMAAAPVKGDQWELVGHGISQEASTFAGPLAEIAVTTYRPRTRGSFVRLSEALGSPVWGDVAMPLGDLWDCLPENRFSPLTSATHDRRTPLFVYDGGLMPEPHPLASVNVCEVPPWVVAARSDEVLQEYLRSFPSAHGYTYPWRGTSDQREPNMGLDNDGWGIIPMHWPVPSGAEGSLADRLAVIRARAHAYGSARYLFPSIGGSTKAMHPLMAWWAVLHTLSMLARYQPAEWSQHINVDHSQHAVSLESLLENAITTLPSLIASAIDEVSAGELTSR